MLFVSVKRGFSGHHHRCPHLCPHRHHSRIIIMLITKTHQWGIVVKIVCMLCARLSFVRLGQIYFINSNSDNEMGLCMSISCQRFTSVFVN